MKESSTIKPTLSQIVGIMLIFFSIYLFLEPIRAIIDLDIRGIKGVLYALLKLIYGIPIFYLGMYFLVGAESFSKLLISNILDAIGMLSYVIPGFAEIIDAAWAPLQGFIVYKLYGYKKAAVLSAAEEILPGTDIIPSATILWLYDICIKKIPNIK